MKVFFGVLIVLTIGGQCSPSQQNTDPDTFPFQFLLTQNNENQISPVVMSDHIPRNIVKVCVVSQYNPPHIFYDEIPKDIIERSGLFPVDESDYYIVYLNDNLDIESYDYIGIDRTDFYYIGMDRTDFHQNSDGKSVVPLCAEPDKIKVSIRDRSGFSEPVLSLRME